MFSLSVDIRDKLDQMRQEKRNDYEKYLKALVSEQHAKTKKAHEIYTQYEEAIREYQRLIDSRQEALLLANMKSSQSRILSNNLSRRILQTPVLESLQGTSEVLGGEDIVINIKKSTSSLGLNSVENSDLSVEAIATRIKVARELCNSLKEDYSTINALLKFSHKRIASAREDFYHSLLEFNKLEENLVQTSSKFEIEMKAELDNNIQSLELSQTRVISPPKKAENISIVSLSSEESTNPLPSATQKRKAQTEHNRVSKSPNNFQRPILSQEFDSNQAIARSSFSSRALTASAVLITPLALLLVPIVSRILQ